MQLFNSLNVFRSSAILPSDSAHVTGVGQLLASIVQRLWSRIILDAGRRRVINHSQTQNSIHSHLLSKH